MRQTTDEALLRCLRGHPHLLLTWGTDRYVLGAPQLAVEIGELPDAAGMSRTFLPGAALRVARREALWAVSKAADSGRSVVRYGDDSRGRRLSDEPAVLTALVEHVLGEVLRYDEAHDSQVLVSVRTWMERNRRTETAAAALHIRPNTLAYRLRRFDAPTDHDMASTSALAEVWPAIQAAGALGLSD
ncbi:helix-turn-helix domain-containing protein [Streptomyces sp. NBC_00057]|uniref:helix-turn-helix domain-containing protein n=1 Tax=Streptomyces sp. NBC_00057 TaxID=2975634 RepID=UPI00386D0592